MFSREFSWQLACRIKKTKSWEEISSSSSFFGTGAFGGNGVETTRNILTTVVSGLVEKALAITKKTQFLYLEKRSSCSYDHFSSMLSVQTLDTRKTLSLQYWRRVEIQSSLRKARWINVLSLFLLNTPLSNIPFLFTKRVVWIPYVCVCQSRVMVWTMDSYWLTGWLRAPFLSTTHFIVARFSTGNL